MNPVCATILNSLSEQPLNLSTVTEWRKDLIEEQAVIMSEVFIAISGYTSQMQMHLDDGENAAKAKALADASEYANIKRQKEIELETIKRVFDLLEDLTKHIVPPIRI